MIVLFAVAQLAFGELVRAPDSGGRAGSAVAAPTPPTRVEADAIEYLYKEHRTVMTGRPFVTFRRADATLVCRKMVSDHNQEGDIYHAVCEGDVKLTRGEKFVTCKRATYDAETSRIVCRGDPVLHDGKSIMYCDEVIYDIERDKVFLKQSKGTIFQKPGQVLSKRKDAKEKEKSP